MSDQKDITRRDFFKRLPQPLYEEAIEAIEKYSHLTVNEALDEICDGSDVGTPLTSVFAWGKTEQRHEYWSEINAKYFNGWL